MKLFKKIFTAAIMLLSLTALPSFSAAPQSAAKTQSIVKFTYTYERVKIGTQWWMYVYDEDGTLVDMYPIYE